MLQPIAEWNPTSTLTDALRELWGNPNPSTSTSLATTEPILVTLMWVVIFIVGVRAAERPEVPLDQPLADAFRDAAAYHQRVLPAPALLAVGLVLALVVLLPAKRLQLGGMSSRGDRAVRGLRLGARVPAGRPAGAARFLVPILIVAYIAPFVVAPERVGADRPAWSGRPRRDPPPPPMKNVTPPDDPSRPLSERSGRPARGR